MTQIPFSTNWNNKLYCDCFTTIRLKNDKYIVSGSYEIMLKGEFACDAVIVSIKEMKLNDINEFIAHLDTGLTAKECQQLLINMYSKYPIDWTKQILQFILLKKLK